MGALTAEERRRVFLARQDANRQALARLSAPIFASEPRSLRRRLNAVLRAAMIVALLSTGWLAYHVVEFRVPASIADAMPRL
jgi:hypothetical protein